MRTLPELIEALRSATADRSVEVFLPPEGFRDEAGFDIQGALVLLQRLCAQRFEFRRIDDGNAIAGLAIDLMHIRRQTEQDVFEQVVELYPDSMTRKAIGALTEDDIAPHLALFEQRRNHLPDAVIFAAACRDIDLLISVGNRRAVVENRGVTFVDADEPGEKKS